MEFKRTMGITKYDGKFPHILKSKSKALEIWDGKMMGVVAGIKNQQAVPAIYKDDVFVGEATISDIAERTGCPEDKYHCVKGTEHESIYLTHEIKMNEMLNKCSREIYLGSDATGQIKLKSDVMTVMAKMTDKVVDLFDRTIFNTVCSTAPRLPQTDTITDKNILQKIEMLGNALKNDPELPVTNLADIQIIIPSKYETFFNTAVKKAFGDANKIEKTDLLNGIRVGSWDGYTVKFVDGMPNMLATTKRAWLSVFACFESVENIKSFQVEDNLKFKTDFMTGGGFNGMYLRNEDSRPVIKEIAVAYEDKPSTGNVPVLVQAPNESEGLRLFPTGSEEAFEAKVTTARTEKVGTEVANVTYKIEVEEAIRATDGDTVDKAAVKTLGKLKVTSSNKNTDVTDQAYVTVDFNGSDSVTASATPQLGVIKVVDPGTKNTTTKPIVVVAK